MCVDSFSVAVAPALVFQQLQFCSGHAHGKPVTLLVFQLVPVQYRYNYGSTPEQKSPLLLERESKRRASAIYANKKPDGNARVEIGEKELGDTKINAQAAR